MDNQTKAKQALLSFHLGDEYKERTICNIDRWRGWICVVSEKPNSVPEWIDIAKIDEYKDAH